MPLPIIYTAHHAGVEFGEFTDRTLLDEEGKPQSRDMRDSDDLHAKAD